MGSEMCIRDSHYIFRLADKSAIYCIICPRFLCVLNTDQSHPLPWRPTYPPTHPPLFFFVFVRTERWGGSFFQATPLQQDLASSGDARSVGIASSQGNHVPPCASICQRTPSGIQYDTSTCIVCAARSGSAIGPEYITITSACVTYFP